jgi:hypothetical protein
MPVLESTDNGMPRSALRHRPLDTASGRTVTTTAAHPIARRASRVRPRPADDDLISEWKRGDLEEIESASDLQRETNPPVRQVRGTGAPSRRTPQKATSSQPSASARKRGHLRAHPLLFLGLGMLAMLILWQLLTAGLNWWNNTMDYLHYGYPRTYQTDAIVGHSDSASNPSHFIATNLHGHIEIIEFPGGDGSHARVFLGPQLFGPDADTAPVTLKFIDINGDHRPDMLVFFQSSWILFVNDQGSFRAPTEQEHQDAVQYFASHGEP